RKQCGQLVTRNSSTRTLPVSLDSRIDLPDASAMTSSGDLRGTGIVANAGKAMNSSRSAKAEMRRTCINLASLASGFRQLFPFFGNVFDFSFGRPCRILGSELSLDDAHEHPWDDECVEGFHRRRRRVSGKTEVRGPMQRVLQPGVLVGGISLGVVLEPA